MKSTAKKKLFIEMVKLNSVNNVARAKFNKEKEN